MSASYAFKTTASALDQAASYTPARNSPLPDDAVDFAAAMRANITLTGSAVIGTFQMLSDVESGSFTGGTITFANVAITADANDIHFINMTLNGHISGSLFNFSELSLPGSTILSMDSSDSSEQPPLEFPQQVNTLNINTNGDYESYWSGVTVLQLNYVPVGGATFDLHAQPVPQPANSNVLSGVSTPFGLGTAPGGGGGGGGQRNRGRLG